MDHPKNVTAVEGQRVMLACGADAFPENVTHHWYRGGVDVRTLFAYKKRLMMNDGGLVLTGVVKEDTGWYSCRPSNIIGHDEASAYLNVTCMCFPVICAFTYVFM